MIRAAGLLDLTKDINPTAFARYLKRTGWAPFETKREQVRVFQHEDHRGFFQIRLPIDKKLSDFREATYRAVETLATVEGRPVDQVLQVLREERI